MPLPPPDIDIHILGPVRVWVDGQERLITGSHRRSILCFLALQAGENLSVDRLVDMVWGEDPPRSVRKSLQVRIHHLRKTLGVHDTIVTTGDGYVLDVAPHTVDAHRLQRLASSGRTLLRDGRYWAAAETLRAASREHKGRPLADIADLPAARGDATRLDTVHDDLEIDVAEAELHVAGKSPDVASLEALTHRRPFEERAWGLLMTALYRTGRQADALAAFQRCTRMLAEELGLDPGPELRLLEHRILTQDRGLDLPDPAPTSLPNFATTFIGREHQVGEVAELVSECRIVTLTGLGGAGKTRLAVEAATAAAGHFPDGIVFADLAPLTEDHMVTEALSAVLGAATPGPEAIISAVGSRRMLVIMDNCDQIAAAAAEMAGRLLRSCPGVAILTTSRVPLDVVGETVWRVPDLAVPSPTERARPADALSYDSVALFLDRAELAQPGMTVNATTAPTIAEICEYVGGSPLAIELAAARSNVLSPGDMAARLRDGAAVPPGTERDRPNRHHTMEATVEWSLDLLDEAARTLFRRMGVFRGPVDLKAVEQVCGRAPIAEGAVADALGTLVSASLVHADVSGERASYTQPHLLRQVSADLLAASAETDDVRDLHSRHFAQVAARAGEAVGGPDESRSFEAVDATLEDLRAALSYSVTHHPTTAMEICAQLGGYWKRRHLHDEGRRWVSRSLASSQSANPQAKASVLHTGGALAFDQGDLSAAETLLGHALELRQDLDDRRGEGVTRSNLAGVASDSGDHATAYNRYMSALNIFEEEQFEFGIASTRANLGIAAEKMGNHQDAHDHLSIALDHYRRIGNPRHEAYALERLAQVTASRGDPVRASALSQAAHAIHTEHGQPPDVARSHWGLAARHVAGGNLESAATHVVESALHILEEDLAETWWVPRLQELSAAIAIRTGEGELGAWLLGTAQRQRRRMDLSDTSPTPDAYDLDELEHLAQSTLGATAYITQHTVGAAVSPCTALRHLVDHWGEEAGTSPSSNRVTLPEDRGLSPA